MKHSKGENPSQKHHKTLRLWTKRTTREPGQDQFETELEECIEFVGVSKAFKIDPTNSISRNVENSNFLLLSETGELLTWNTTARQSKDDEEEQYKRIPNLFIGECIVNVIVSKTRYLESKAFNSWKVAVLTKKGEVHLFRISIFQDRIETTEPQKVPVPSSSHHSNPLSSVVHQVEFGLLDDLILVTSMGSVYIYEDIDLNETIQTKSPRHLKDLSSKHITSLQVNSSHSIISCITKAGEVYTWTKLYYRKSGKDREYYGIPKVNKTLIDLKVKEAVYQSDQTIVACTEDGKVYNVKRRCLSLEKPKDDDLVPTRLQGLEDIHIVHVSCDTMQTLALTSSGYVYRWDSTSRPSLVHELKDYNVVDVFTSDASWSSSKAFAIVTDSAPSVTRAKLDVRALLNNEQHSDFLFMVENQPIHAKAGILVARSEYFRAMFESNMRESIERMVKVPNSSRRLFFIMLEYLHTDVYSLDGLEVEDLMDLYEMADMYQLEGLMSLCMVTLEKIDEHQIDCDGLRRSICFEDMERQDLCDQMGSGVVA